MATAQDLLAGIQEYYPYIDTGGNLMTELERRAAQGATVEGILPDVAGFAEVGIGARKRARSVYGPGLDFAMNQFDLESQGLRQNEFDINRNYDNLGRTLAEQAQKSRSTLTENFNNLGLLQSGMTASGLGDVESTLARGTKETEQERASRLASIALERAGLGVARQQAVNQTNSKVDDLVSELLGGSRKSVEDLSAPATTLDLGNRVVLLNKKGQVVGQFAKGSLSGGGSAGGSSLADLLTAIMGGGASGASPESEAALANLPKTPDEAKKAIIQDIRTFFSEQPLRGLPAGYTESSLIPALYSSFVKDAGGNGALSKEEVNQLVYAARRPFENQDFILNPDVTPPPASKKASFSQRGVQKYFPRR
jgi:hypothetical protein